MSLQRNSVLVFEGGTLEQLNQSFKNGRGAGQADVCLEILKHDPSSAWQIAGEFLGRIPASRSEGQDMAPDEGARKLQEIINDQHEYIKRLERLLNEAATDRDRLLSLCAPLRAGRLAMGDQLVEDVCKLLVPVAFANGVPGSSLRPIIDVIVNRLRAHGHTDEEIINMVADV